MLSKSSLAFLVLALVGSVSCFPESRVVNGTATDITTYPFMVSLRGPTGSHSCGSSIIAPRWILTAAHCVSGRTASQLSIQYATTTISANGANVIAVKRIIMHEGYNPSKSYANDIALLELQGQLIYNYKTIAPVTLPESYFETDQVSAGSPGVLAGWGLNATGGVVQSHLQSVDLKIYSDAECQVRHNYATTADHICGGVDEGGKGQCSGDSGGPLLYKGAVQVGIVSWSIKPCTVAPYPGVYTKVSHYIDWIYKHIN
ncbi:chymotrypsin-2 [Stomoxys calcitrans]|uniref:Peptidase S1 domain-containing protein n=1 Tax=Stomoxys calcitrans TaxID=35570 RepID=A0A1I8QEK0_STOCA|nr:chymotrypsin-2 [Stomoxys calcitrans]